MRAIIILGGAVAAFAASIASAQPAAPAGRCAVLQGDYDTVEKNLAARFAGPRSDSAEFENLSDLLRAQMTLDLMREAKCPLPARAPNVLSYLAPALKCVGGDLKSPECDRTRWTRRE